MHRKKINTIFYKGKTINQVFNLKKKKISDKINENFYKGEMINAILRNNIG